MYGQQNIKTLRS